MNDLVHLGRRINDREEVIQACKRKTLENVNQTIAEALLQGQDLIKAKANVPHGQWLAWLVNHCPNVGERQARRYMQLASNRSRVSDLLKAGSLRQAMALLEDGPEHASDEARRWPPYLEAIGRLSKLIGYVERFPVSQWPDEGRDKFRDEMLPIAKALWPDRFE